MTVFSFTTLPSLKTDKVNADIRDTDQILDSQSCLNHLSTVLRNPSTKAVVHSSTTGSGEDCRGLPSTGGRSCVWYKTRPLILLSSGVGSLDEGGRENRKNRSRVVYENRDLLVVLGDGLSRRAGRTIKSTKVPRDPPTNRCPSGYPLLPVHYFTHRVLRVPEVETQKSVTSRLEVQRRKVSEESRRPGVGRTPSKPTNSHGNGDSFGPLTSLQFELV